MKFLSRVRDAVKAAGYDVAGIRISTQPFPEYTRGLSHADALKLLRSIDELGGRLGFNPNIGPAMVKDTDDTAPVDLIAEVLSMTVNRLNANIVTAGDDGIHWKAVRNAAVEADVSSSEAACSDVPWARLVPAEETWKDALATWSALSLHIATTRRRAVMLLTTNTDKPSRIAKAIPAATPKIQSSLVIAARLT